MTNALVFDVRCVAKSVPDAMQWTIGAEKSGCGALGLGSRRARPHVERFGTAGFVGFAGLLAARACAWTAPMAGNGLGGVFRRFSDAMDRLC